MGLLRLAPAALAVAALAAQDAGQPADAPPLDAVLTDCRWLPRPLAELAGSTATVLFFATIDCPIVRRYLPRVDALARDYEARGVRVLVVNVGPEDGLVDAAAQQVELAPAASFAKDFDGSFCRQALVERTACALLLDAARRVVYRGRVDGQDRYAGATPAAGREDLRLAIEDLLAGRPVQVASTTVEGCKITAQAASAEAAAVPVPTFGRDVQPLLAQHCQECHRPGGEAPFALETFEQASAHLAMLGEVVAQQRMPPWYGSRRHGEFVGVRGLPAAERATIAAWVAAGGPAGPPVTAPPQQWPTGEWRLGEPDLVLKMPAPVRLPAEGYVPYQYLVLPFRFEQDTWVEAIEIKPEHKDALHHCNLVRVKLGEKFSQDGFVTGQVPGGDAMVLDPGQAVRIPAGSALVLQAHYVTTGKELTDRLRVGLRFPRVPVEQELHVCIVSNSRFEIPPGAGSHPVRGQRKLAHDSVGIGLFAHMHLRGRDMLVTAQPPGLEPETLLLVPNYNFDWQQSYRWQKGKKLFAAGTAIAAVAHFDNSTSNPFNPDATRAVRFGQETFDEMMYAFLFYVHRDERLGLRVDPRSGHALP